MMPMLLHRCDCVIGRQDLVMEQSPESEHLGTTVWDSSIVVAKYFEKVIITGAGPRMSLVHGCPQLQWAMHVKESIPPSPKSIVLTHPLFFSSERDKNPSSLQ